MAEKDDQTLLTAKEMAAKNQKFLYFEDGEKKIDCVIAYDILAEDEHAATKEGHRETYFKNLEAKGLVLEKADCKQVYIPLLLKFLFNTSNSFFELCLYTLLYLQLVVPLQNKFVLIFEIFSQGSKVNLKKVCHFTLRKRHFHTKN